MCYEECIGWRAIVVGKERPGLFQRAMGNLSQGWSPEGEEGGHLPVEYPIDIVLGLEREARLTRMELTVIGWMAPHRVDIKLAEGRAFLPLDYGMAQKANYFEAGKIKFPPAISQIDGQQNGMIGPKFRRAHFAFGHQGIQRPLRFIWLVLHSPHPMETNPKGKIALTELKIFGLAEERRTNSRRMRQLFPKFPIGGEKDEEEDLEDVEEEEEGEGKEKIKRKENKKIGEIFGGFGRKWGNYEGKRNSSKGRQIRQFGEAAEDFVQIEEKLANARQKAQKEGNVFRAMLLERALGDLGECQTKMFSLRSQRTIAAAQGREDEAEFLRGSMSNCMETYSRANQLDLLLEAD